MMHRNASRPGHPVIARVFAAALLAGMALPALAQPVNDGQPVSVSRPVVQSTTGGTNSGQQLNAALSRLARDPRNISALIDAGNAALKLGDTDAAVGFFTRADQVQPGNGQVKAQIGAAMLRGDAPLEAIGYFDDAEKAGADAVAMAADRGLAYDLVGDNANAQRQYQLAQSRGAVDEVTRRYALSLAIAGDRRGAETVLSPLVARQERAAWRIRTFIMAITGNPDEAVAIAYASMPQDLAAGIAPYLRYMPRLTPAQQAAAANLGKFPRAADIGRDDPRVTQYAALHPRTPRLDAGLIPQGASLGGRRDDKVSRDKRRRPGQETKVAVATPAPQYVPPPPPPPGTVSGWGVPARQPAATTVPAPVVAAAPAAPQPAGQPLGKPPVRVAVATITSSPTPGFSSVYDRIAQSRAVAPTPKPEPTPKPQPTPAPVAAAPSAAAAPTGFDLSRVQGTTSAAPGTNPSLSPVAAASSPIVPPIVLPTPAPVAAPPPVPQPVVLSRLDLPPGQPVPARPVVVAPIATSQPEVQPPAALVAQPVVQATPAPAPKAEDFRSLFDGFRAPAEEQSSVVPAVDISQIPPQPKRPPEPKAEKPEKLPKDTKGKDAKGKAGDRGERPDGPISVSRTADRDAKVGAKDAKDVKGAKNAKSTPSHPSRIWIQVLTGANRDQMGTEWKRMVKEASVLKGRKPSITPWRSNFRLLTGPFESEAAAQDFLNDLRKAGVGGFQWTSPAGQAVDSLPLK